MLAYFVDHFIDKYEWFIRVDDDSLVQWDNLEMFINKLDSKKYHFIGSPGFGKHKDDFIEDGMDWVRFLNIRNISNISPGISQCSRKLRKVNLTTSLLHGRFRCYYIKLITNCSSTVFFLNV